MLKSLQLKGLDRLEKLDKDTASKVVCCLVIQSITMQCETHQHQIWKALTNMRFFMALKIKNFSRLA
jgi:hypothetical protein